MMNHLKATPTAWAILTLVRVCVGLVGSMKSKEMGCSYIAGYFQCSSLRQCPIAPPCFPSYPYACNASAVAQCYKISQYQFYQLPDRRDRHGVPIEVDRRWIEKGRFLSHNEKSDEYERIDFGSTTGGRPRKTTTSKPWSPPIRMKTTIQMAMPTPSMEPNDSSQSTANILRKTFLPEDTKLSRPKTQPLLPLEENNFFGSRASRSTTKSASFSGRKVEGRKSRTTIFWTTTPSPNGKTDSVGFMGVRVQIPVNRPSISGSSTASMDGQPESITAPDSSISTILDKTKPRNTPTSETIIRPQSHIQFTKSRDSSPGRGKDGYISGPGYISIGGPTRVDGQFISTRDLAPSRGVNPDNDSFERSPSISSLDSDGQMLSSFISYRKPLPYQTFGRKEQISAVHLRPVLHTSDSMDNVPNQWVVSREEAPERQKIRKGIENSLPSPSPYPRVPLSASIFTVRRDKNPNRIVEGDMSTTKYSFISKDCYDSRNRLVKCRYSHPPRFSTSPKKMTPVIASLSTPAPSPTVVTQKIEMIGPDGQKFVIERQQPPRRNSDLMGIVESEFFGIGTSSQGSSAGEERPAVSLSSKPNDQKISPFVQTRDRFVSNN